MSTIAVLSWTYCSADEIVEQVAERLGYSVVSDELIESASRSSGVPANKIRRALIGSQSFFESLSRAPGKGLIHLKAALAETLKKDQQIIWSPAALLIPPKIRHVLRVEIVASRDYRIEQAIEAEGLDESSAIKRIDQDNREINDWIERSMALSGHGSPSYDIRVPLPATSRDEAVDIICRSAKSTALKPTESSIRSANDFELATHIEKALAERKLDSCNVTVDDGKVTVIIHQKSQPPGKLARTVQSLRFESAEEEVRKVCAGFEEITSVHVRPGSGYRKGAKTLLVDDEKEYVMTLSERLELRDIESDVVYDGQQAMTFMETETPDVMVLDLKMPGMHGLEVLERIKQDHPEVQVIVVTGHGGEDERRRAFELGAFDYMEKPVDIGDLSERIQRASRECSKKKKEQPQDQAEIEKDSE